MTLRQLLAELASAFHEFEDPKLEARHLLMEAMDMDLNEMILRGDDEVLPVDRAKVEMWRLERMKGMPLAYLAGHKAFYKSDFIVRPGVLVPRPETELVVETALVRAPRTKSLADFGCGSGCIGLSLLGEWPEAKLFALDKSATAVEVTRENAVKLHLLERVEIVNKSVEDWDWNGLSSQEFDLVVANPPYIAKDDPDVQPSVREHEPYEALFVEDGGLAAFRTWSYAAFKHLRPGGVVVFEIGRGQDAAVAEILHQCGFRNLQTKHDLNQIARVISGEKPGQSENF